MSDMEKYSDISVNELDLSQQVINAIDQAEQTPLSSMKLELFDDEGTSLAKDWKGEAGVGHLTRGPIMVRWGDQTGFWLYGESDGAAFFDLEIDLRGKKLKGESISFGSGGKRGHWSRAIDFELNSKKVTINEEATNRLAKFIKDNEPNKLVWEDDQLWKKLLWNAWGGHEKFKQELKEWWEYGWGGSFDDKGNPVPPEGADPDDPDILEFWVFKD